MAPDRENDRIGQREVKSEIEQREMDERRRER